MSPRLGRSRRARALALALMLAGCVDLKPPSAGPADASTDALGADPYATLQRELAGKRVRLTDLAPEWFVSRSRVYTIDSAKRAHSFRPPDGPTIDYTFQLLAWSHLTGNDDYVVDEGDNVTVYAAGETQHVIGSVTRIGSWTSVNAASKAIAILQTTGTATELLVWNPLATSAPETAAPVATSGGLRFMRARDETLYFAETTGAKLWTIDTAKKTAEVRSLSHTPTALDAAGASIVSQSATGGVVSYELVTEGSAPRDLTAEIMAAESIVPVSARRAMGSFSQAGDWLVYAAWGGILAFDIVRGRLVACQLRDAADGLFLEPRVLEDRGLLVFSRNAGPTQGGSSQGLYFVQLASVLPP